MTTKTNKVCKENTHPCARQSVHISISQCVSTPFETRYANPIPGTNRQTRNSNKTTSTTPTMRMRLHRGDTPEEEESEESDTAGSHTAPIQLVSNGRNESVHPNAVPSRSAPRERARLWSVAVLVNNSRCKRCATKQPPTPPPNPIGCA